MDKAWNKQHKEFQDKMLLKKLFFWLLVKEFYVLDISYKTNNKNLRPVMPYPNSSIESFWPSVNNNAIQQSKLQLRVIVCSSFQFCYKWSAQMN